MRALDIEKEIKKGLKPGYIIMGDDEYLKRFAKESLLATIPKEERMFSYIPMDLEGANKTDIGSVIAAADTYSMFGANSMKMIDVQPFSRDLTKDEVKRLRIREIYNAVPSELNSKNKRFVSSHVVEKSYLKNKNLNDEFLWLTNASVSIPVYNVTEATLPLQLASERKTLKLFVNDIGLLDSMLFSTGIRENLLNKKKEINYGAPYENVVAQELKAHGFNEKIFYYNSKKHGEVDFIVEYNNEVLPIEIKSGKPDELKIYNHTALNNLINMYSIDKAFVFGECNVVKETSVITQFPIYMISFIKK